MTVEKNKLPPLLHIKATTLFAKYLNGGIFNYLSDNFITKNN